MKERVEVVKKSYSAFEKHSYTVCVGGVIMLSCSCPEYKYRNGPCRHVVAVGMEASLIDVENAGPLVKAAGA